MIRTKVECKRSLELIRDHQKRIREAHARLEGKGWKPDEIAEALAPMQAVCEEMQEEVAAYTAHRSGDVADLQTLGGVGRALIALRIASGLSQRELADRLEVHVAQVSRDERTEYHGVTMERATRVLDMLGANIQIRFQPPSAKKKENAKPRGSGATGLTSHGGSSTKLAARSRPEG
jgi:ribosome-binding protein aMBF1 (putative translation factor)